MKRANQVKFLKDLIFDLGMDIGTEIDNDLIQIYVGWGRQYNGNLSEIKNKIQVLEKEIKRLGSMLKE